MPSFKIPFLSIGHVEISFKNLLLNLKKPKFVVMTLSISFIIFLALVWMSNLSLFWFLLTQNDPSIAIKTITSSYEILSTNHDAFRATLIVIFSVLQGINLSLFFLRPKNKEAVIGSGVTTGVVAVGVGCGACGTTLLTPIVTSLGLGSSVSVDYIGIGLMLAGIVITLYSVHRLLLQTSA